MKIQAYPNFSDSMPLGQKYDLNRWMAAMKDIYVKLHLGASKTDSVNQITNSWNPVEKREFLDWLRYYESGDYLKYKKAQHSYYVNDDINYFLPNPKNIPTPIRNINDEIATMPEQAAQSVEPKVSKEEERRNAVEDMRRKILGRLNAAEKLISSQQGHIFAGSDFERILSSIYELKKQIQTVNKISLSAQTMVDLIVRRAGMLSTQGHAGASEFFIKFAQNTPGDFSVNLGEIPAGGSQPQGLGSLSNNAPDLTQPPNGGIPTSPEPVEKDTAIGQFMDNLNDLGITEEDKNVADDQVEIDDDVFLDQDITSSDKDLVVHAQMIPQEDAPLPTKIPKKQNLPPPVEKQKKELGNKRDDLTVADVRRSRDGAPKDDFDVLIDSAFSNLNISDVVNKLEDINKIFRNREIGRQLAIVDIMLDHLGLAPYFPSLAEATNKQLEANQYCLTRIEDILSKLRGTMETAKIDLINENQKVSPEAETAKNALEQDQHKENQRKEMKKKIQDKVDAEKIKPEAEIEGAPEELAAQPVEIEEPTPAPKPATPIKQ